MDKNFEKKVEPFRYWISPEDGRATLSYNLLNDGRADEIFNGVPKDVHFKGNGHDWEFLAKFFLDENEQMKEIKNDIQFDSESGMFYTYSDHVEAFQKFALEFRKVFDSEEQTRYMKEIFEQKDDIILARNRQRIEITISDFKEVAQKHPDLILYELVDNVETYRFVTNDSARISINQEQVHNRIEFYTSDLGKRAIGVHYTDFYDETRHFEKLYKSELEKWHVKEFEKDHFIEVENSNDDYVSVDLINPKDDVVQKKHKEVDMEL